MLSEKQRLSLYGVEPSNLVHFPLWKSCLFLKKRRKNSKKMKGKYLQKSLLFIPPIIIGTFLFLFLVLDLIFMEAQNLYSNYKTALIILVTLSSIFLLLYNLINFKEKIDEILFVFTATCVVVPFACSYVIYADEVYKLETNYYVLKALPSELNITEVIYKEFKHFGMGFGGIEEGFYIFKLPDKIAEKVNLSFLENLYNINNGFDPHKYGNWHPTPIKDDLKIPPYLKKSFRFSFIYPDSHDLKILQNCIENEGNYYIYQGGGATLIISPKKKIVFYVYKG